MSLATGTVLNKEEIRSALYTYMTLHRDDFAKSIEIQEALFQFGVMDMTELLCRDRIRSIGTPSTAKETMERELIDLKLQLIRQHIQIKLIEAHLFLESETREANATWINQELAKYDCINSLYKKKRFELNVLSGVGIV